ncbi:hypothetical protein [Streptomyces sp. NRRL S-623]|uniref:hypothetical protein n=1 Tax=Streptomyces TaxID=1883 RepID=UPI003B63335D
MTTSQAPRRMNFPAAQGRAAVKGWLGVPAVTLGIFSLMTSELLPVGLLTPPVPPSTSPQAPRD